MDRTHRRSRFLSEPTRTVLATPLLGSPLSRELVHRIEAVEGVRVARIGADGQIHGDAYESAFGDAEVLLLGTVPSSVVDTVLSRAPRLRWIHSASAGVDRLATAAVRDRRLGRSPTRAACSAGRSPSTW